MSYVPVNLLLLGPSGSPNTLSFPITLLVRFPNKRDSRAVRQRLVQEPQRRLARPFSDRFTIPAEDTV